jgi:hypothetical protein
MDQAHIRGLGTAVHLYVVGLPRSWYGDRSRVRPPKNLEDPRHRAWHRVTDPVTVRMEYCWVPPMFETKSSRLLRRDGVMFKGLNLTSDIPEIRLITRRSQDQILSNQPHFEVLMDSARCA